MSTKSAKPTQKPLDAEGAAALAALKRARQRAEEVAARTGTMLIQAVNGKPIRVKPRQEILKK
jgi:hypothetical protein